MSVGKEDHVEKSDETLQISATHLKNDLNLERRRKWRIEICSFCIYSHCIGGCTCFTILQACHQRSPFHVLFLRRHPQLSFQLLLIRPIIVFFITQVPILRNRLGIFPRIRKQRILLCQLSILQQSLSRILISHTTKRYTLIDMLLIWLTFHKRSDHWDLWSSGIARPAGSCQPDCGMSSRV